MSNIADRVRTAQDKDGMLRRALERIIQLYTDKSHFVYELLQNAEDAEAKDIKFIQHADHLEVLHDGKPFTSANLQGLCDIGKSDKVDNLNQIGEFGVGFKSVFGICDTVLLYSDPSRYTGKIEGDEFRLLLKSRTSQGRKIFLKNRFHGHTPRVLFFRLRSVIRSLDLKPFRR